MAIPCPGYGFAAEVEALKQISLSLSQLPGRKNLLWFSGGSLLLLAGASSLPASIDLRPLYDMLETSRIALYPIDARGLRVVFGPEQQRDIWSHLQMDEEATATGGHAFFNTNGIAEVSLKIIATDANFYTLSYSPRDFRQDNKWHQVTVKVDGGPYLLSYRTGYFGDGSNAPVSKAARTVLSSGGEKIHLPEAQDRSEPIIFNADVEPSDSVPTTVHTTDASAPAVPEKKKNETSYTIRYTVPVAAFVQQTIPTGKQVQVGAGLIALNQYGRPVSRLSEKITLTLDANRLSQNPNATLYFDQQVSIPKGQNYLLIVLWDTITGRYGTIQVPVKVDKSDKADKSDKTAKQVAGSQ